MKLALLGATGGIGGHLLTWALDHGHDVHALARRPGALADHHAAAHAPGAAVRLDPVSRTAAGRADSARADSARAEPARAEPAGPAGPARRVPRAGRLTVTAGDALDAEAVAQVVAGADAVLSALGPRGAKTPHLLGGAAAAITAGMARSGARRLIAVSAAGAYLTEDPDAGLLVKLILPRIFGTVWADVRQMEDLIRAADLDWTLVRPARLVNAPGTSQYRVRPGFAPPRGSKIARADVAQFIEEVLVQDTWRHATPALAY